MLRDIRHIFIYGYPEPKEIGIYKVLGASTGSILKLLMKVLLVLIGVFSKILYFLIAS